MNTVRPAPLLKTALLLDAAGTGAITALQLGLGATLAPLLQLPPVLVLETGLFMVAYVALLLWMARSERLPTALVWLVIIGNLGWALGAIALIWGLAPSALGIAFLLVHAVSVTVFAGLQHAGLKRSAPAATSGRAMVG